MIRVLIYKIKKNHIAFFFFKIVVLLGIVLLLDFSIGKILNKYYFKQESGLQYRTTYSIEKTTADVLVFGSSRANHHYHPEVFEKNLHLSYYNVGRDGSDILYHTAILNGVMKRYTPKVIILDLNAGEFEKREGGYDRLSVLLPYYKMHPEMRSIIELKSKYEKYKLLSDIYPYNSSIFTIAIGNTDYNKNRKGDIKGYIPINRIWTESLQTAKNLKKYDIDSVKLNAYKSFVQQCVDNKIELYIVQSPIFLKYEHLDYSIHLAKDLAVRTNIPFYDYSIDSTFIRNSKLFADKEHLNDEGARLFSKKLINLISHY